MTEKITTKELWNDPGVAKEMEAMRNAAKVGPGRPQAQVPPSVAPRPPVSPQQQHAVHSDEQHPADDDYLPPVNTVSLPSRGVTYPPTSPLYLLQSVDVKPVSAKEENILGSINLIRRGVVLTTLMRACITNRLIDPDEMLPGDRNAVLVAIRVSAYGSAYNAKVLCTECGESGEAEFNLSRLELKGVGAAPCRGQGSNAFEFILPSMGKQVVFRLLTAIEQNQLDKDIEAIRKATGDERGVTMRLQAQVLEMQGVAAANLGRVLENMPARDSRALRNYMDKIAPGVEMVQAYECKSCGKSTEVDIPIGTGFFWPAAGE